MAQVKKVLKNGVKVYDLREFCEPSIEEAQDILNVSYVTEVIDAECAYSERVANDFVGVYEVAIERETEYREFLLELHADKCDQIDALEKAYNKKEFVAWLAYKKAVLVEGKDEQTEAEKYNQTVDKLKAELAKKKQALHDFREPTYEEWKSGMYAIDDKRKIKLGKALKRAGFSQKLLDFYSVQIKTEKTVFLTISDFPQHIAGMSYYAKIGSWDGYNGTSCQDPRHDAEMAIHLAGSLHDNKLFVAMLHESLEDLADMEDKLKARTVMRLLHIDNRQILVATSYYGNNTTKNELHNALEQLEEVGIFSQSAHGNDYVREEANGSYSVYIVEDVHICENDEYYVNIRCPLCNGTGLYEVETMRLGWQSVTCPHCRGEGRVEEVVWIDVDEWQEVEDEAEILPYAEGYNHIGTSISMGLDLYKIRTALRKYEEA